MPHQRRGPENFTPSPGPVKLWHAPGGPGIRVDSHLYTGYTVPPYYDSLIAKIIAHGEDRDAAIARMRNALNEIVIEGIKTNVPLHKEIFQHGAFRAGGTDIHYLERRLGLKPIAGQSRRSIGVQIRGHSPFFARLRVGRKEENVPEFEPRSTLDARRLSGGRIRRSEPGAVEWPMTCVRLFRVARRRVVGGGRSVRPSRRACPASRSPARAQDRHHPPAARCATEKGESHGMPYLQLTIDIGSHDPAPFEDALFGLGALSVTLEDAADDPVLEPAPGETPLWPTITLKAIFDAEADPATRRGRAGRRRHERCRRRASRPAGPGVGARVAEGLPADALRPPALGLPGRHASGGPDGSASSSIPAWRSAPARTRRPRCASNGWTATTSRAAGGRLRLRLRHPRDRRGQARRRRRCTRWTSIRRH